MKANNTEKHCKGFLYAVNLGSSGFDLTDDFILFRRRSGLTEDRCF